MTQIINDNVQVELTIGGDEWLVSEAIVERSRMDTPDYVDMIIIPQPEETAPNLPTPISDLIGSSFRLEADNELISNRDTDAEEDNLLFSGNLANISPTGETSYEAIAYDPSQQAFAETEGDGGSIMNQTVRVGAPKFSYNAMFTGSSGVTYQPVSIKASELLDRIVDTLNLDDVDIQLSETGQVISGDGGIYSAGFDTTIEFDKYRVSVKDALQKAKEWTKSEWWFDKEGTFHFGVPEPSKHALRYITDASAGKVTPPYQSIRVIGSGSASQEGRARTSMNIEDKIVFEAELAIDEDKRGQTVPNKNPSGELPEPTFEYRNLEISNDAQAENVIDKIAEELIEQEASGTVTVVGFPEVVPLDGIVMPQADNPDAENYSPNQPMGGATYNVYKVTHFLNSEDGFITQIEVAGVSGVTKTVLPAELGEGIDFAPTPTGAEPLSRF